MSSGGLLELAVLISGRGSNMAAIARACRDGRLAARIVLVIADRRDAGGLATAHEFGLATAVIAPEDFDSRALFEAELTAQLERSGAQLILLAGFMRILSPQFAQRFAGHLLNIHPSLLPRHKGLHTHRRALAAGEREHGASVHFVTGELDGGPLICQARVAVLPDDTEQSLAARVLAQEHLIYRQAIGLIAAGRLRLEGATVLFDGQRLSEPIVTDARA